MKKLKDLIPNNKKPLNEAVEDMEVALPARVEKFLERLIQTIKSYNLPKKKEQAVIARVIDSLQITPSQLTQTVQKLKKYDVVRKKTGNADHDWMGEEINEAKDNVDAARDEAIEALKAACDKLDNFRGVMNDTMDVKDIRKSQSYKMAVDVCKDIRGKIDKLNNAKS